MDWRGGSSMTWNYTLELATYLNFMRLPQCSRKNAAPTTLISTMREVYYRVESQNELTFHKRVRLACRTSQISRYVLTISKPTQNRCWYIGAGSSWLEVWGMGVSPHWCMAQRLGVGPAVLGKSMPHVTWRISIGPLSSL